MAYDVFISYSRKDTEIADRVCAAFDKAGISYFIDRQGIAGGMEFPKVLAPAIKESKVFLLLASENAYQSAFTTSEINYALNKKQGKNLLPYIIDGSVLPDYMELVFSRTTWRTLREHPIDTVLVDDVLRLLGRTRKAANPTPHKYSQQELEELNRKGDEYYDAKQHEKAVDCYRKAAEQGYATAQCNLGYMYETGHGVPQDYSEAVRWYRKAAEQGYANAQFNLGCMYDNGQGVPQDYGEAVRWYRKAAEQGNATAQYNLALMYKNGQGVPQDKGEARRWFQKAAEQGDKYAKKKLQNL